MAKSDSKRQDKIRKPIRQRVSERAKSERELWRPSNIARQAEQDWQSILDSDTNPTKQVNPVRLKRAKTRFLVSLTTVLVFIAFVLLINLI
jgi:hypothetical protein